MSQEEKPETTRIMKALEKDSIMLALEECSKELVLKEINIKMGEGTQIPIIFIDARNVLSPLEFVIKLMKSSIEAAEDKNSFEDMIERLFPQLNSRLDVSRESGDRSANLEKGDEKSDWKYEGDSFFTVLGDYFGDYICFIVDGFSECFSSIIKYDLFEAERFLKWLRSSRARHEEFRFIFVVNTQFENIVMDSAPLSSILDLRRITLERKEVIRNG